MRALPRTCLALGWVVAVALACSLSDCSSNVPPEPSCTTIAPPSQSDLACTTDSDCAVTYSGDVCSGECACPEGPGTSAYGAMVKSMYASAISVGHECTPSAGLTCPCTPCATLETHCSKGACIICDATLSFGGGGGACIDITDASP